MLLPRKIWLKFRRELWNEIGQTLITKTIIKVSGDKLISVRERIRQPSPSANFRVIFCLTPRVVTQDILVCKPHTHPKPANKPAHRTDQRFLEYKFYRVRMGLYVFGFCEVTYVKYLHTIYIYMCDYAYICFYAPNFLFMHLSILRVG